MIQLILFSTIFIALAILVVTASPGYPGSPPWGTFTYLGWEGSLHN